MKKFYSLEVKSIKRLTLDSVAITFNILDYNFDFIPGQYITIKQVIKNEEVRRSYSISSSPGNNIEIGVKLVNKGLMSTYLTKELKEGDVLEVMPPTGNFYLETNSKNSNHYVGICAGSGITPILSMIRQTLAVEPESDFTLIYGNKKRDSVMFVKELQSLEQKFQSQFFVYYAFSRENVEGYINGRLNKEKLEAFFAENQNIIKADKFFLCGPGELIDNTKTFLIDQDIKEDNIYFERFTSGEIPVQKSTKKEIISHVTVSVDGDDFEFDLSSNGISILDAAMEAGADVPFSCKGGVCCVCKAKVMEGEVEMDQNFSLSEDEVNQGFVLTCQSHPLTTNLVIDFDEI